MVAALPRGGKQTLGFPKSVGPLRQALRPTGGKEIYRVFQKPTGGYLPSCPRRRALYLVWCGAGIECFTTRLGYPFAGMTNLALRIFMQYSGRFVIPFIVLGKSERILPAPFFSTQIPIIEVESGRVIEIDGGGRDKAQRPCSLAGFLEGFRPSLIKFSKEVAGWKRTDWARG